MKKFENLKEIIDDLNKDTTSKRKTKDAWLDVSKVVDVADCPICNGSGMVIVDEVEEDRGWAIYDEIVIKNDEGNLEYKNVIKQRCECVLRKEAINNFTKRIKDSGLVSQLESKTFKTFEADTKFQKEILAKCMEFSREPQNMLALLGQTGAGKTHLGTAVVGNLVTKGYNALYVEWKHEMNIAKDDYYKVKEDKLAMWKDIEVLYIDDLFKNQANDVNEIKNSEFEVAWDILDHRLKRNKITIISSEFTIEDFLGLDEGTGGRLNEMAGDYLIDIPKDVKKNYRIKNII